MSRVYFPDPLGVRQPLQPGATNSQAGLSREERLDALERGAASRPGPGVVNGSVLTANNTEPGLVAWKAPSARFKAGFFATNGTTGNRAVTGIGFAPGLVRFTVQFADSTSVSSFMSGVMTAAGDQFASAEASNSSGSHARASTAGYCILAINASGVIQNRAVYVSMDADGFTVNFDTTASGATVFYEAFA